MTEQQTTTTKNDRGGYDVHVDGVLVGRVKKATVGAQVFAGSSRVATGRTAPRGWLFTVAYGLGRASGQTFTASNRATAVAGLIKFAALGA